VRGQGESRYRWQPSTSTRADLLVERHTGRIRARIEPDPEFAGELWRITHPNAQGSPDGCAKAGGQEKMIFPAMEVTHMVMLKRPAPGQRTVFHIWRAGHGHGCDVLAPRLSGPEIARIRRDPRLDPYSPTPQSWRVELPKGDSVGRDRMGARAEAERRLNEIALAKARLAAAPSA
jgi:hypothetical protein